MFFVRVTRFAVLPLRQLFSASRRGLLFAGVLLLFGCLGLLGPSAAIVQNQPSLVIASAASYESDALAPESLATAFGLRLATQNDIAATPQLQLGGTTVEVAGRAAPLLFVSSEQVNFLVPAGVPAGPATVTVRAGDGTISMGTTSINAIAPALFTAGEVVSGFALRVKADGAQSYEPVAEIDVNNGQYKTKAIDLNSAAGDQVFLVFFLSGLRNADPSQVRVILGGDEFAPVFAGAVPGAPGLDQINLLLSRDLTGKGVLDLVVTAPGARPSKSAEVEIGGGVSTLAVRAMSKQTVVAGETLEIEGTNLPTSNVEVLFGPNVGVAPETATPTKMTLRVPFGVTTDAVKISVNKQIVYVSPQPLNVVTSVSGFVQEFKDSARVAVAGMPVVLTEPGGRRLEAVTNSAGAFLIRDAVASSRSTIQIKGLAANGLNYEVPPFSVRVLGNRDNQASREDTPLMVELRPNGAVTTSLTAGNETAGVITAGQVVFDTNNSTITCPGGVAGCQLALAVFAPGRTPTNLPAGVFSSTIAQITPFGARLAPGGKLTFPNSDSIPAGTPVRVYRFDQTTDSATFGQFVDIGAGMVSGDGQRLETAANAVSQASYYFISRQWPTATVIGHVVEADGVRPVRRAVVSARGQSTFTDGNGGFVLRNVPVIKSNDAVTLEVSFHRANGTVSRTERAGIGIGAGAQVRLAADLVLSQSAANVGPAILAPTALSLVEGETREFSFIVTGLAANVLPVLSGASFATVRSLGNDVFALRLAPAAGSVGSYPLTLAAGSALQNVAVTVLAANANVPIAQVQAVTTDEDTPKAITLAGTNAGNTPGYAIVRFPLHGTLTGTPPNLIYTPAANYNGTDSFRFSVGGGNDMRSFAEVSLAIRPVNDPPVLTVPGAQTIGAGQTLALTITAVDPDGDALTLTAPNAPPGATQNPPQTAPNAWRFTWTPTVTLDGDYTINFTVSDNATPARGDTKTITARVEAKWANTSGPEGQFGVINALLASGGNVYAATEGGGISRSLDDGRTWGQANVGLGGGLIFESLAVLGTELFAGGGNDTYGVYRSPDQGQTWVASGLDSYVVFAITSVGGNLFAAAFDGGIFRSTDRGRTWTPVNQGLPAPVQDLIINSLGVNGSALFAGILGHGVFRSLDQGNNWTAVNSGLPEFSQGLALATLGTTIFVSTGSGVYRSTDNGASWTVVGDPVGRVYSESLLASGNTLYAGTGSGFDGSGGEGIYRSTDGGQSWTQVNQGLTNLAVKALAATGTSLLAGTVGGNVFRSADQGQNWTPSGAGLRNTHITAAISSNGVTLASVSFFGSFRQGVYRSPDNGQTWIRSDTGLPDADVIGFGINGTTFFAGTNGSGVYRSTDQGRNWTEANNGLPSGNFRQFTVVGNTLYAGAGDVYDFSFDTLANRGVYRSSDNGQSWVAINAGLPSGGSQGEAIFPLIGSFAVKGATLFAMTDAGLFRLNENAANWVSIPSTGLPNRNAFAPRIVASGNSLVVSGGNGPGSGLYRSTDDGLTFTQSQSAGFIGSLVANGDDVYAGGHFGVGIYFSSDQGRTFKRLNNSLTNTDIAVLALSGTNLFAGTGGLGVFLLTNNVQSWSEANAGLAEEDKLINTVAANGATLLAGTLGRGVLRSLDHGQQWTAANTGLPPSTSVQSFASFGANVYLGAFGQGVFRSTDNGANWSAANTGLANLFVNALQPHGAGLLAGTDGGVFRSADGVNWVSLGLPNRRVLSLSASADGRVLLAGTNGGGIFRSTDNGQTWTPVTAGLSNQTILALTIGNDGSTLFAGTDGGVFRSTDQGVTWSGVNTGLPTGLSLRSFAVSGGKLYAGSFLGVFLTEDGGASWKQINAGLLDIRVGGLALDGGTLLAGTSRRGLFLSAIPNNVCPLSITAQPGNRSIADGQTAALNVTVTGVQPIRYQWYRGASGDFSQPIAGATGNSFTTPALNATTNYWVLVTSGCGSVNSETASVLVNSAPQADVAVTQTISPAQPKPGDDLTFTLNLTNGGRDTAFAVTVISALPAEVVFTSCHATGGGVCGGTGNNRVVTFSALAVGDSATVTIVAKVNAGASGATLRSTASASAVTTDTNPANNTDIKSLTVQQTAPVISSLNPNTAVVGGGGFTLTVNGSNFVSGAKVRWNGSERATSFGSATQLTAQIPAADLAAAGTATVTVVNPDGQVSAGVSFMITAPLRQNSVLRVVASTSSVGSTVAVPIELVSQGDENALGFSLTFDPAILSNPQVALGNGASGAALNPNLSQVASGRVGLVLAMPSGQRFAAGVRQIVVITFTIAANTGAATASLEFGNQPIPREVSDVNANELGATYTGGAVTITRGFEADVAPRPNGNGSLSVTDWVLVGRFASGDLAVEPGSEFQRTDCAPRSTFGNGSITVSDWVQAGRYAAGLDPLTPAAGPTSAGALVAANLAALLKMPDSSWPRLLRVTSPVFGAGQTSAVTVELLAQGEENAVSFSLRFDARQWRFVSASVGEDARNAALSINAKLMVDGQVGFALALPPGQRFEAGMQSVLTVNFAAAEGGGTFAPTPEFSDLPTARELADVKAEVLTADWMPAALSLFTVPSSTADEQGLAAGVVIRVGADGRQSFESLAVVDSRKNGFVAVPIEVGDENEQVFLALFGTGWQNGAALDAIQVTVDGLPVEVLYAGAQGAEADIAQLNLRLPPALSGRGEVTVQFINAGRSANPVKVVIK